MLNIYFPRRRSKQPVKIDLKINMTNFGPVSKGNVQLKPLTIFVGPNNSGKSYVAMLIHSIISSENQIMDVGGPYGFKNPNLFKIHRLFDKDIQKIVKQNKNEKSFNIPESLIKKISTSIIQDVLSANLESAITRNFGASVSDLIRSGQNLANINVSNSSKFDISIKDKLDIQTDPNINVKYKFEISSKEYPDYDDYEVSETMKKDQHIITINKHNAKDFFEFEITSHLLYSICEQIKHSAIPADSFYFPAARSGILQGHKALSASIIKSAQFGGIQSFQIPKLTGVVSDFISNIIVIPNHPGPFIKLAKQLESDLLHGHIKLPFDDKDPFPEITYRSQQNEIPLHRTSSTISEIAPLSLYLKHIVYPSSLLIIEEPEAHLHPTNQLIFAKYIVKMIRAGLNVLITTHSVFLLEQLGKFMLASKIKPEIRKKELKLDPNDFLCPDEVSPYVFVRNNYNDHKILPIEVNDEEGISQEEFVKVNELLHSESIKFQENMPEN